jgi:hypothetical protein
MACSPSAVHSVRVLGPWPVGPARIVYSSTAPLEGGTVAAAHLVRLRHQRRAA